MKELRHIHKYFLKYKYRLLAGIIITITSKIITVQIPQYVRKSLDIVERYQEDNSIGLDLVKSELLLYIGITIGIAILSGFFTFAMRQTIIVTSRLIEFDLKNEVYQQYQRLSLSFYNNNRTGDLMNRISEDVGKVRMYFGPALMYTINMLILFIVAITKMFQIDTTLAMYSILPLPVLSVSIFVLSKIINKRSTVVQQYLSKMTTFSQEMFSGISVVKSYAIEKEIEKEFYQVANESKEKNISLYKAQALFFPLMMLLIGASNVLIIYVGGNQYIAGEITLGTIAEFIMYINMLTWPVAVVGWVTSMVQQAEVSQGRINEFLKQEPSVTNYALTKQEIKGVIEFENVNLTYKESGLQVLNNMNFTVKPGETLAVLGKVGTGKSSVLNLIARLFDVDSGNIKIDGIPIKDYDLQWLRKHVSMVPQEAFLFSDTIENNIKFGKQDASYEEVIEIAQMADIHENIMRFNGGYKTVLGERGITLSGGQRQRVSIARALIKDSPILLFDDCLSAVDTATEEKILYNLKKISKEKTTIIVSHRVSSVKHADKIIVLENGIVSEQGTHEELLYSDGYYKYLYDTQIGIDD
ncbi:MAG: ABC transporter ATP-binding protein [Flavobacteriaceae bacterium]|nr:ABC transporter ATP-binding protein [Flavobacteriaceae bacterium]